MPSRGMKHLRQKSKNQHRDMNKKSSLTTKCALWAFSGMYAPTLGGLLLSYYMALPFFKFTLLGDLFYVALFFGAYGLITSLSYRYRYKPATAVYSHSVVPGGLGVMS